MCRSICRETVRKSLSREPWYSRRFAKSRHHSAQRSHHHCEFFLGRSRKCTRRLSRRRGKLLRRRTRNHRNRFDARCRHFDEYFDVRFRRQWRIRRPSLRILIPQPTHPLAPIPRLEVQTITQLTYWRNRVHVFELSSSPSQLPLQP